MVITEVLASLGEILSGNLFTKLTIFTLIILLYSVFIFYFYRFLAKKNIVELNLKQYNNSEHSGFAKFIALGFYIIEYIIILPIVTLFWFSILSIFLIVLSKNLEISAILTITTALVASVRISSYISQKLSQDLAKMLPFTLLALAIIGESFFSVPLLLERIGQIPSLLSSIPYYLIFIVIVELAMRALDLLTSFFRFESST